MTKIFISYSRKDEEFARELTASLLGLGADVWIDVEDIPVGVKWSSAIQGALDSSDAMIVIISPDSMASSNVEDEWQYFYDRDKPVIPVLLREAKIPFQLNRVQWIDFKELDFEIALIRLHEVLARFGIHITAPPHPPGYVAPLSQGHIPMPEPIVKISRPGSIYIGGAVVTIVVILLVSLMLLNGNISGKNNQPTETATHGLETQVILNLTQSAFLTATYDAVATNIVGAITETQAFELTANAPTNTATASATMTNTATNTPDATLTAETILIAESEATALARAMIDEQETQDAQGTANAPTNTPQPTATATATITPSPTNTATSTPSATPTVDIDATNEALIRANQTVEAQIAETAEALNVQIELGRVDSDEKLNVRANANTNSAIITETNPGSILAILGRNADESWLEVETADGQTGWVSADFVRLIGTYPESNIDEIRASLQIVRNNDDLNPLVRDFDDVPMVFVPAGCFILGLNDEENNALQSLGESFNADDEQPTTEICLELPFWIDQFEVSQGQFAEMGGIATETSLFEGDDLPVTNISWAEAKAFCELRGASLPSEVQWEYAARGVDNNLYPWGNRFDFDALNWNRNGDDDRPGAVDLYPGGISWVGAYQMAGNVSEWTLSGHYGYPTPTRNFVYLADITDLDNTSINRVARGSSYLEGLQSNSRITNRIPMNPSRTAQEIGFRCVRDFE